ncbi:hypothetical protein H0H81_011946 [Sphagnurus paluster]|uniref:Uncharacterized protein n=1 Tax=Sphagnurus paluster TaxID=117069 RepID=A0A9P7K3D2_9AGAR|nr:hypothetical protein H0H81_011946 [Sphagnurus paluster]
MTNATTILSQCSNLLKLEILIELPAVENQVYPIQTIYLPVLEDFTLHDSSFNPLFEDTNINLFLDRLRLPALTRLSLDTGGCTDIQLCDSLASLIMRSNCALKELYLMDGQRQPDNLALEDLLRLCSGVHKLNMPYMAFMETVLVCIARGEILPMLEDWSFNCDMASLPILEDIIKARRPQNTPSGMAVLSGLNMIGGDIQQLSAEELDNYRACKMQLRTYGPRFCIS